MPVLRSSAASPIVSAVRATRVAGNSVAAASRPISTAGRPKTNYLTSRYTPSVRTTQPRAPVLATAARSRDRSAQPLRSAHGATAITAPPTAKVPQPSTAKVPQPGARSVSDLKKAIAEVKAELAKLEAETETGSQVASPPQESTPASREDSVSSVFVAPSPEPDEDPMTHINRCLRARQDFKARKSIPPPSERRFKMCTLTSERAANGTKDMQVFGTIVNPRKRPRVPAPAPQVFEPAPPTPAAPKKPSTSRDILGLATGAKEPDKAPALCFQPRARTAAPSPPATSKPQPTLKSALKPATEPSSQRQKGSRALCWKPDLEEVRIIPGRSRLEVIIKRYDKMHRKKSPKPKRISKHRDSDIPFHAWEELDRFRSITDKRTAQLLERCWQRRWKPQEH